MRYGLTLLVCLVVAACVQAAPCTGPKCAREMPKEFTIPQVQAPVVQAPTQVQPSTQAQAQAASRPRIFKRIHRR